MLSLNQFNQLKRSDQLIYLINNLSETSINAFKALERLQFTLDVNTHNGQIFINSISNVITCMKYAINEFIVIVQFILSSIQAINIMYQKSQNIGIEDLLIEKMNNIFNNIVTITNSTFIQSIATHLSNAESSKPTGVSSDILAEVSKINLIAADLITVFEILLILNSNFCRIINAFDKINIILNTPGVNIWSYQDEANAILSQIQLVSNIMTNLDSQNSYIYNIQINLSNIDNNLNNMGALIINILNNMEFIESFTENELITFKVTLQDYTNAFNINYLNTITLFRSIEVLIVDISNLMNKLGNQVESISTIINNTNTVQNFITNNNLISTPTANVKGYSVGIIQNFLFITELAKHLLVLINNTASYLINWSIDGLVLYQVLPQIIYSSTDPLHIVNIANTLYNNAQVYINNLSELPQDSNTISIKNTCQSCIQIVNEIKNIMPILCNHFLTIIDTLNSFSYLVKILSSTQVDVVTYKNLSNTSINSAMTRISGLQIITQSQNINILTIITRLNNIITEIKNMSSNINRISNEIITPYLSMNQITQIKNLMNNEFTKFGTSYNLIMNYLGQIRASIDNIYDYIFSAKDNIYNTLESIPNTFGSITTFKTPEQFAALSQSAKDEYGYALISNIKAINDESKTIFSQLLSIELQMGTSSAIADANRTLINPSQPENKSNPNIDIVQLRFENLAIAILKISIYIINLSSITSALIVNTYTYLINWSIDDLVVRKILDVFSTNGVEQDLAESVQVMNALYTKYLAMVNQYQITSEISDLLATHITIINTLYPLIITYLNLYIIMSYLIASFGHLYSIINDSNINIDQLKQLITNYLANSTQINSMNITTTSNNQIFINIVDYFNKIITELKIMMTQVIDINNIVPSMQMNSTDRQVLKNNTANKSLIFATSYNRVNHYIAQINIEIEKIQNNIYDTNTQLYTILYSNTDANLFQELMKKLPPMFTMQSLNQTIIIVPFFGPRRVMTVIWVSLVLGIAIFLISVAYKYFK